MYIGPKLIQDAVQDSATKRYTVSFDDGSTEEFSQKMYEASQSEEPVDLSILRENQIRPLVGQLLGTLLEWDIKFDDLEAIESRLRMSMNNSKRASIEKLFGKELYDLKMSDLDRVLKS